MSKKNRQDIERIKGDDICKKCGGVIPWWLDSPDHLCISCALPEKEITVVRITERGVSERPAERNKK